VLKEFLLDLSDFDFFCCFAIASTKPTIHSDSVGPARMLFTVTPVPATDSAIPRAAAIVCRFRHAVVHARRGTEELRCFNFTRSLASKHICFVSRPVVLPHILSVVIDTAEKYRTNAVVSEVFRSS
jgi:hypothetical protein